ncbi:excinuclease ABC subunit UvrC [bacterium]|nr:excinuclease ABC subunit UvrC [bacterium]
MIRISPELAKKLESLPDNPGVYLWKDKDKEVIYVGKAKNLKNRIRSYLQDHKDRKTRQLQKHIYDLDYIVVGSESNALILEASMIRKYSPRYNVMLKDDKRYPFIKITNDPFPKIEKTRTLVKDGGSYYGPYSRFPDIRKILSLLEWIFPLRNCNRAIPKDEIKYQKACINYQLKKCLAPCIGNISHQDYLKLVKNVKDFLQGKHYSLMNTLKEDMQKASDDLKFELAGELRDKIRALEKFSEKQNMFFSDLKNRDIIAVYREETIAAVVVLKMVEGRVNNKELYPLKNVEDEADASLISYFIIDYYSQKEELPDDIIVSTEPDDMDTLNEWLKNRIKVPQKGEKNNLVLLARKNAFMYVEEKKLQGIRSKNRTIFAVQELKDILKLDRLPRKMVCMDISTIQGEDTVSSAVYFENGKPLKSKYRHFIIKSVVGQDDFASMAETITRFLNNCRENNDMTPDLIVIDGGKGQLNSANAILKNYPDLNIQIISLAKRVEEVYLPQHEDSIIIPKTASALKLLTHIRDESHRFAITFHRKRRSARTLISKLDGINGISEQLKFSLLKEFGSVDVIKNTSIEELTKIKGIGENTAKNIIDSLNKQDNED